MRASLHCLFAGLVALASGCSTDASGYGDDDGAPSEESPLTQGGKAASAAAVFQAPSVAPVYSPPPPPPPPIHSGGTCQKPMLRSGPAANNYRIDQTRIIANVLEVAVTYGGGCKARDFQLVWDRTFSDDATPRATARLSDATTGDNCKAFLSETVQVDLADIRAEYAEAFGTASGTVSIDIDGHRIDYSF